jgi:hypothetical protein
MIRPHIVSRHKEARMEHLPAIPYLWIETALFGVGVMVLAAIHLWRVLRSEFRSRTCVFCGDSVRSEDHAHHLEICGLTALLENKKLPKKVGALDSGGTTDSSAEQKLS